ncbi:transglutaminase-like domain-containing protein [Mucilaginibacter daejeonensis]|uniref:transglutaminase-like domain-containing protein n=1 Tax=Mucilaginibacter daejeonensis TaxID=398049 RepID=UPI001D17D284|nr:transglutaminase-like domain-containing protein [Mucilaginibacter daejeonensis]UEG54016.1 transglutaminase-like domain-containing protein [Mucilaginibacter daejeonensis]
MTFITTFRSFNKSFILIIALLIQIRAYSQETSYRIILENIKMEKDPFKYKAAIFLEKNIPAKSFHDGESLRKFDELFSIMSELKKIRRIDNQDPRLQSAMDSLVEKYGDLSEIKVNEVRDSTNLTSDFLKENLDYFFKVRAEKSWLKNMPDTILLEYILPYRVGMERLDDHQRSTLYNTYNFIKKSSTARQEVFDRNKSTDLLKFTSDVQYEISRKISTNGTMWNYPYDVSISKMELGGQGSCNHLVGYTTAAMRSVGIPIASDFCIRWGNNRTGHKWNVLFMENGKELPFDAAQPTMDFNIQDRKVAKVYRERFSKVETFEVPSSDVPESLFNPYWEDVTRKYTVVADVRIKIPKHVSAGRTYALIGTFNNANWEPQFYAPIINGQASYREMGVDNIYIGMYKDGVDIKTFGDPFSVNPNGKIIYLRPVATKREQDILRKYPRTSWVKFYENTMVGGTIECVSNLYNSAAHIKYTVMDVPDSTVSIPVRLGEYRYIKYTFPDSPKVYVAEITAVKNAVAIPMKIDVNESDKDLNKVIDMDINSYYWGKKGQTITFDLGKDMPIDQVRFTPRSDSNFIVADDEYELCYWKNGEWVSLGRQLATSSRLKYNNVPENALFILHNLTGGREERIFTIKAGLQKWW